MRSTGYGSKRVVTCTSVASQGGMFCYQAAAYRRSVGLTSVVTFGSPADTSGMVPFGIPEDVAGRVLGLVADNLQLWGLPSWASSLGFKLMDPLKSLRSRIDFVTQLGSPVVSVMGETGSHGSPG